MSTRKPYSCKLNNLRIFSKIKWYQIWCSLLLLAFVQNTIPCSANELAIGPKAKIKSACVPIAPPVDLSFKTRSEIFAIRKAAVLKYPQLTIGEYTPGAETFGMIEDRKPWWGIEGLSFYGAGQNSIKGLSIRSPIVLNPFLLAVDEHFLGAPTNISATDLARKSSVMFPPPSNLNWWPQAKRAEVTYNLSSEISQWNASFPNCTKEDFGGLRQISVLNARDLGLKYVFIPPNWGANIKNGSPMTGPMPIPQFIHCGNSCGYPGGCNNESPTTAWLDSFTIEKLPARIGIMFWKLPPKTGSEPPDMTFMLNYR